LRTRRRRLLLLVIGLIVLLAAGLVAMLALAPGGRPAAAPGAGTGGLGSAPLVPGSGEGDAETPAPTEGPSDGGTSGEGPGGQGPGDDGGGNTPDQPPGPCATTDRKLAGAPDPVRLKLGATKGTFTIHNCTDEPVDWLAATKPSVTLADEAGTIEPGATFVMGFTVDTSKFDTQEFMFRIQVRSATSNFFYIEVYGRKLGIGPN
jgi:hypothetical protein